MADSTSKADLIGFTLTHQVFRNELPRLAAAFDAAADQTDDVVEDHLRLVTDHLLRHHQEEDEFHWPLLASRVPGAKARLDLLEAEHTEMDPLMERVRDQTRTVSDRAVDLRRLTDLVIAHLDEEDRSIVPLLQEHITGPEQFGSMQRSRAKIPASDELRVLAMMLDAADEEERKRMLAPLPPEVHQIWRELAAPGLRAVHDALDGGGRHQRAQASRRFIDTSAAR